MDKTTPSAGATDLSTLLDMLREYSAEAAASYSDAHLAERVMTLFRAEDMEGMARLMKEYKLEREFVDDLEKFIVKWRRRMQGGAGVDSW